MPVVVEFKASKPVSINAKLEFHDTDGHRFSVPVLACADNCLLTVSRFLSLYGDKYALYRRDDGPVMLYHQAVVKVGGTHCLQSV